MWRGKKKKHSSAVFFLKAMKTRHVDTAKGSRGHKTGVPGRIRDGSDFKSFLFLPPAPSMRCETNALSGASLREIFCVLRALSVKMFILSFQVPVCLFFCALIWILTNPSTCSRACGCGSRFKKKKTKKRDLTV